MPENLGLSIENGREPQAQTLLFEYLPNAEFERWLQRVSKNVIFCFLSCVGLMLICQALPPLKELLFALFRWILIPIKPLLLADPGAGAALVIACLAPISFVFNMLAVPFIVYVALQGQKLNSYLAVDKASGRLLLLRSLWSGHNSSSFECVHLNGQTYSVLAQMPLSSLKELEIQRPEGKKSTLDYRLLLPENQRKNRALANIRWGDILRAEDRSRFLSFLERFVPERAQRSIFEPFRALPERRSYTELWLKELSGAPKRDKLTPLSAGTRVGNDLYVIERKLGMGGQATIYLASSEKFPEEEFVILKEFMLPVYPDLRVRKRAAERFQNEASILSRLQHRQIARFLDLFLEDHRAYLVLEHVEGQSLQELVMLEGAQSEKFVVDIARQLAGILKFLHEQDPPVLHRDLAPDNIMLENGQVKLIDFSVAQEHTSSLTGSVVGKPNYISPEQFRGKPCTQSDIYSLGATIYFLLTASAPPPITVLHPAEVCNSLSDGLDRIVSRCTQLELEKRYASVEQLINDLDRLA